MAQIALYIFSIKLRVHLQVNENTNELIDAFVTLSFVKI